MPRPALALLTGLLGILQLACASVPPAGPPTEEPPTLRAEKGASVERALEGEEKHDYLLRLEKGQYLDLRIQDRGGRLEVSLRDPGGLPVATGATRGQDDWKLLLWVTEIPGEYRLRVKPRDLGEPAGKYGIEIRDLRRATVEDGIRVAAQELVGEGLREIQDQNTRCQGVRSLEQALLLWQLAGDSEGEVDLLNQLGLLARGEGRIREALDWYERTLPRARDAGYREGEALVLNNLGYAHQRLRESDKAVDFYSRSLALWEEVGDRAEQAFVLLNLSNLYLENGRYSEARPWLEQGLALAVAERDLKREGNFWGGIGFVQYSESNIEAAFQSLRRSFDLSAAAGDVESAARVASNLALMYNHAGQLQQAMEFLLDALEKVEEPETRGYVLYNLGGVYISLGKPEDALDAYQKAFEAFQSLGLGFGDWAARSLTGVGATLHRRGDAETALRKYQEAQALDAELAIVKQHLGMASLDLDRPEQALEFFTAALRLAEESSDHHQVGLTRLAMGTAYRRLGQLDLAAEQFDQGIEVASQNRTTGLMAPLLLRRAMLRRDRGQLREAQADVEQALSIIESTRRNVLGQDLQISFFASRRGYQEFQIDLLMRLDRLQPGQGYRAQALAASERARSRGLLDLLAEGKVAIDEDVAPDLKEQETRLAADLSRVQGNLRAELSAASPDERRVQALQEERARIDESRERLEWEIRKRHPRYAQIRYPIPLDLAAIQSELDEQSALLEYAVGQERSFLFVVTREGLETHELPPAPVLQERVLRLRDKLKKESQRQRRAYFEEAYQLYRDLLAPAAEALRGKSRLLIAPDGALHLLPFEALLTAPDGSSFADAPYLLRAYAVSYVPSASVLAELREARTEPTAGTNRLRFVAFADPEYETPEGVGPGSPTRSLPEGVERWNLARLPDSRREVSEIAKLYPDRSRVYLASEAREANVKHNDLVSGAEILHFATHGHLDERHPEHSALLLANEKTRESGEDGMLQAYEIFRLKLSASLVVLSACQTGLGEEVSGEGLVGLARSFFYAGAPSLVVSLWNVSDKATTDLMVPFYSGLDGADKAEALRQAKLRMIDAGVYDHPFYWAPFILIGDPK